MKKLTLNALLFLSVGIAYTQNVGIGTSTPNISAKLDISATDRGLLIPRVALTMTTASSPISSPANALLVYNTATTGNVTPGFYYWSATNNAWIRIAEGAQGWDLVGNNGVTAANFLGTLNAADLNIRTSNTQRMVITATGNVGINDATPDALFTVGAGDLFQIPSSGHALGVFGSAPSPSFSFVGDTDNGMYRSATNELSFSTNATQRAVIDANGRMGINATTPAAFLDINGDIAYREGTALVLVNGANATITIGSTSHLRITGPTAAFSIAGFTGGSNGKILTIMNTTSQPMTILHNSAITANNGIYTPNAENLVLEGQYASLSMQYNSTLGRWIVLSYSKTENTEWKLLGNTGTNATNNFIGTTDAIDFVTRTSNTERMRVTSAGNVGIGIATPSSRLHVVNTANNNKTTIYGAASQTSTSTDYDNIGVAGIASGGSFASGFAAGVVGVGNTANSYYATGVLAFLGTTIPVLPSISAALYANGNALGNAAIFDRGAVIMNESAGDYDLRVESQTRTHALWVDANENLVRFGTGSTASDWDNNNTVAGEVVNYVADFDNGAASGTAMGIGSVEYLLDLLSETAINNDLGPTLTASYDLGSTARRWNFIYLQNSPNVASDERLKTNIQNIPYGLNEIMALRPVSYQWKEGFSHIPQNEQKMVLGLIAQEVQQVMPEVVHDAQWKITDEAKPNECHKVQTPYLTMQYELITPVLIKAIQEQQIQIETLTQQLEKMQALERRIQELENRNK